MKYNSTVIRKPQTDRTGARSSDGKFLKIHVTLEQTAATFSAATVEMAKAFGCDADELFSGSR